MKHPFIKEKNKKEISVTSFKGTVTNKSPLGINEDMLSHSKNLWNDSGVLTTRPAFNLCENGSLMEDSAPCDSSKVFYSDFLLPDGSTLMALVKEELLGLTSINFYKCKDSGEATHAFYMELVAPNGHEFIDVVNLLFIKHSAEDTSRIYIIMPTVSTHLTTGVSTNTVRYYKIKDTFDGVSICNSDDFYYPLILKNGRGESYITPEMFPLEDPSEPEGVNLLCGNFEASFSCDDRSSEFCLPVTIAKDCPVRIRLFTSTGFYRDFFVPGDSNYSNEVSIGEENISFYVSRSTGMISCFSNDILHPIPRYRSSNGLRVWAQADTTKQVFSLFNKRTKPVYFDNRIFLAGGEGYEDRVFFSGQNNPLYFSLKNSFVVGDDSSSVTALSMQNRYVIAFKDKGIYRITLQESSVPDKEVVIEDNSITAMPKPKYTIVRITNTIGCDRPSTIVTCGNRLVWYHSDGGVYTLFGSNLYTDGSVYMLSSEISDSLALLSFEDKFHILATSYKGYYMLIAQDKIFVMDTLVSGFHLLSGHKSADKKYGGLPWFIWNSPPSTRILSTYIRKGDTYFVMCDVNYKKYYITSLYGQKDIYGTSDSTAQSDISFSLKSAMLGSEGRRIKEAVIRAKFSGKGKITLFDRDKDLCSFNIQGKNSFCRYVIPLSCKADKIGISVSGEGNFALDEILINIAERNY